MSPDEIHKELSDINRSLGRIEGRLEGFETLPERVGKLEGWRKWMMGAQAAVLAVFAVFIRFMK